MSDNRQVAGQLMKEAWETISKKRPGIHGSAENSFEMIGEFWTIYLRHARKTRGVDTIRAEDVAEMMALLKKVRKMYGDPLNVDNDVDDLGYTGLAAMLRLPDITKPKDEQIDDNLNKLDPEVAPHPNVEHEHYPRSDIPPDEDGFVPCAVDGCDAKIQVTKATSRRKKADA